jgi:hypothetical protein
MDEQLGVKKGDPLAIVANVLFKLALVILGHIGARLGFAQSVNPEPISVHHAPHADIGVARADALVAQLLTLLRREGLQTLPGLSHLISVQDDTTRRHPEFSMAQLETWFSLEIEQKAFLYQGKLPRPLGRSV